MKIRASSRLVFHTLKIVCFGVLLLGSSASISAQQPTASPEFVPVVVKTWKSGDARITEQVLNLSLQRQDPQYVFDIDGAAGSQKHYQLRLIANEANTVRTAHLPCWSADLREVREDKKTGGNAVGHHLLSVEGPGIGDNIPREEWAGFFCPIEKPNRVLDGLFYPIRVERTFFIEGFLVNMQVTDYQYDAEKVKLNKLDLRIEFKNRE